MSNIYERSVIWASKIDNVKKAFKEGCRLTDIILNKLNVSNKVYKEMDEIELQMSNALDDDNLFVNLSNLLARICYMNKSSYAETFNTNGMYNNYVYLWRQEQLARMYDKQENVEIENMPLVLSDLLMENCNLDKSSMASLRSLESILISYINRGRLSYNEAVNSIRNFCRQNASDKGYYDENGLLLSTIESWYSSYNNSSAAEMSTVEKLELYCVENMTFLKRKKLSV